MIRHKVILARVGQVQKQRDHYGGFYSNSNSHNTHSYCGSLEELSTSQPKKFKDKELVMQLKSLT